MLPAVVCLVALAVAVTALVALHALPTGYHAVSDAVSDYGVGRYRRGYQVLVVSLGVSAGALAWGLTSDGAASSGALAWLWAYAAARVAIAWYPTDLPGTPRTRVGRAHALLAVVAFTAIAVAASSIPNGLAAADRWSGYAETLNTLGTLVVAAAVATAVAYAVPGLRRRLFGLVERLLYLATFSWLATAAVGLLQAG